MQATESWPAMWVLPSRSLAEVGEDLDPAGEEERQEALMLWYSGALFFISFVFFVVHRYLRWTRISQFLTEGSDVCAWGSLWFAFSVTMVVYNNFILKSWQVRSCDAMP
jgi:hypothetical protein